MASIIFKVGRVYPIRNKKQISNGVYCLECVTALRNFIGKINSG